ncbi:hypothetical protein HJG60_011753 [Phyllostomus discolor]|uniref:Uncharacterized protein n=1 Tax=Phyllostomus discolor TaxID=89673 RepID=A0A833ZPB7_9CHIR|nr:hypothetical protein HJG60_011753 [Phyllostomus discolor]
MFSLVSRGCLVCRGRTFPWFWCRCAGSTGSFSSQGFSSVQLSHCVLASSPQQLPVSPGTLLRGFVQRASCERPVKKLSQHPTWWVSSEPVSPTRARPRGPLLSREPRLSSPTSSSSRSVLGDSGLLTGGSFIAWGQGLPCFLPFLHSLY